MTPQQNDKARKLVTAIGATAEMAHQFYAAMKGAGASENEALTGMQAFISSYIQASVNGGKGQQNGQEE